MAKRLFDTVREELPGLEVRRGEPLRNHCSFRIGGPAELFLVPSDEAELAALLALLRREGARPLVLGNGTNILFSDEGISRPVIKLGEGFGRLAREGCVIRAGSAALLSRVAAFAQQNGLGGMEFAHGIPGSLGGAVVMNAGAYGGEMKDIVRRVRCLTPGGEVRESEENGFSYRHSRFSGSGDIILGAEIELSPADPEEVAARMRDLMEKRSASQPLDRPSAGSTFKRPAAGYAAAMIDGAGLKGFAVGGAQVSEKHAGFVINAGGASSADVLAVIDHVRKTVLAKFGVELEPEVLIID